MILYILRFFSYVSQTSLSEAIEFRSSFSVLNQALWKIENGHLFFETYSYFACNLWGKRKILLRIVPLYGDCVFAQVNIF